MTTVSSKTNLGDQPYVTVIIKDSQNNNEKKYQFPDGTIFQTTNMAYHISKEEGVREFSLFTDNDGDEQYGYKSHITNNTIEVTLPQYTALNVLDVNHDAKFDYYDIKKAETYTQPDDGGVMVEESIADFEINDRLESAGSNFRVGDGWGSGIDIDKENYSITVNFFDIRDNTPYETNIAKKLSIFLPEK